MAKLYKAEIVRRVCSGVTARQIDYWVTTMVLQPAKYIETARRGRKFYLFGFEEIVQIQIVANLRRAGVSLQTIRGAIERLRKRRGQQWQSAWLVTDGKKIYQGTDDPEIVESLSKGESGQMAFALIAIEGTKKLVESRLKDCEPTDVRRFAGEARKWAAQSA